MIVRFRLVVRGAFFELAWEKDSRTFDNKDSGIDSNVVSHVLTFKCTALSRPSLKGASFLKKKLFKLNALKRYQIQKVGALDGFFFVQKN